jgi:5'-nucleotidase
MATKRILVSNDDGINHPAMWALVNSISDLGEVTVSAPDRNCSGVGTSMTLHNPVRAIEVKPLIEGIKAFAVQGMPSDAVVLGLQNLADGSIDAVVTGINPGNNVTENVLVSGTVGAAYAAHLSRIPAMAVSMGYRVDPTNPIMQRVISAATSVLLEHEGPALINLNFPWADDWPLKGAKITYPAPQILNAKTKSDTVGVDQFYWIGWELVDGVDFDTLPDNCDIAALRAGFVSINSMAWPADDERDSLLLNKMVTAIEAAI